MLASTVRVGNRDRTRQLIPAAIAVAGGLLLIVQWAAARPLWLDEEMIAINLRDRSIRGLAGPLALGQTAPYGWLVLQRIVLVLAGDGELALRAVPVLFGLALLATAYWIGRRWLTPPAAATLVLLCAVGRWLTFHVLEMKPYSADAFFALLLPALGVLAIGDRKRAAIFWLVAAVGQWFANGALLVTPASALVLLAVTWHRHGARAAADVMAPGVIWLALFTLHYAIVLRHAIGSDYLQGTWAFAFPPRGASVLESIRWTVAHLRPLASKPGGTGLGIALWLVSAAGFVFAAAPQRALAAAFALVPLSAFALAMARLVPLYERVSIWIVPALYVGIALLADAIDVRRRLVAAAAAVGVLAIGADISVRGVRDLRDRPADSNRQLTDRDAIRWLQARRRPGDVWFATHFALPALWWYGDAPTDRVLEVDYRADRVECLPGALRDALPPDARALVYLGFRFDDTPRGFDDLLVDRVSELGAVTGYRRFATHGIALIVDPRQPYSRPATLSQLDGRPVDDAVRANGCIAVSPALRW